MTTAPSMLSPIAPGNTRSGAIADVLCTHCRQVVPRGLVKEGSELQFCCHGCDTAYHVIHSCGLDKYYALREAADQAATGPAKTTGRSYAEYDDETFRRLYVRGDRGGVCSTELVLEGVHCAACLWLVERLPRLMPGVLEARLNLRRSLVTVTWRDDQSPLSAIARCLDHIGYPPHPARDVRARQVQAAEDRRQLVRIGVAGACAGNVMLLAICLYAGLFQGIEPWIEQFFRWLSLGITAVCLAWPGRVFFRSAWAAIRTRTPHLDVPITLALVAGLAWSIYTTIRGSGEIYFDSLSVLVFVLLSGRFVQQRQQRHAADSVELLFAITPRAARLVDGDTTREVTVESLSAGDVVEVRAGESFPVDGHVVLGSSSVDQSLLTGESRPARVDRGGGVLAGAVNLSAPLRVCVAATGEQTRVGRLMRMVEECSQRRAPIIRMADRLSGYFVVGMLALGVLTFAAWLFIDPPRAVDQGVALLVVTCPCALGLATPLTLTIALGRAARRGMLIKGGDAVQQLAKPGIMFLDKTGTLTLGRMSLVRWQGSERVKPFVGAIEARSSHPIALALARDLAPAIDAAPLAVRDVEQVTGAGIRATVDGSRVVIGSPAFVGAEASDAEQVSLARAAEAFAREGLTPVLVAVDGRVVAAAGVGDQVRADVPRSLERLRRLGWDLRILSGDHEHLVAATASRLGLGAARGGLSPEDKLDAVRAAQGRGRAVVFVGDGVNDAAALAAADVGIAVHGGAEASLAAADVYLHHPGLGGIVELVESSARTMKTIRRNLVASFVYNIIAVAGTLAGFVTPLLAALIMPASSVTVLSIASRSRTFDPPASGADRVEGDTR